MKKKNVIIIVCVAAVVLSGAVAAQPYISDALEKFYDSAEKIKNDSSGTVVAVVNGESIYKETIDFYIASAELSASGSAIYKTEDKTEILDELIRDTVVRQEAERLGLEADYNEAYDLISSAYGDLKKQGGENYEFLKNYLKKLDLTESEYLQQGAEAYRRAMTRSNLYSHFVKDKTGTDDELLAAYDEYVKQLIEKSEIEYK